jgi:hypothetical protein
MLVRLVSLFLFLSSYFLLQAEQVSFSDSVTVRIARGDTGNQVWLVLNTNELYRYNQTGKDWTLFPHQFKSPILFTDPAISANILLVITAQQAFVFNTITQKQIAWFPVDSASAYRKVGEGVFVLSTSKGFRFHAISTYSFNRNKAVWEIWKSLQQDSYSDSALITAPAFTSIHLDTTAKALYAKSDTQVFRWSSEEYLQPVNARDVNIVFEEDTWVIENGIPVKQPLTQKTEVLVDSLQYHQLVVKPGKPVFYKSVWFGLSAALLLFAIVSFFTFSYFRNAGKRNAAAFEKSTLNSVAASKTNDTPKLSPFFLQHFIDWIQSYVLKGEKVMAYEMLEKFKELMLLSIAMNEKKEVTIDDEMKLLSTYLELEQSRLNGRLAFLVKADDNVSLKRKIPAMLLLPYVLEAVEKSIQPETEQGRIWIVFKISGMSLQVIIDDNGLTRTCSVPGFENDARVSFYPGEKEGNRVALLL